MNKTDSLIILIKSLSKAEKRYFRLLADLQSGDKAYLALFDLLDGDRSLVEVYARFEKEQEGRCVEMAAKHLYRVLLDCLLRLREKQDVQTEICNRITKAGILFERGLTDDSFDELGKAKLLATDFEHDLLLQLIRRTELKYLSACDFKGISERELVGKQMKVNEIMKYSRNINQHLQLYDILKHRLTYKGYARSDKQKEDLNDLVLSELHLIANSSYRGFEAEKLHLLFQATYYLNSGNYKSAIRYYQELINLFEENKHLLLNPPIYYLSALRGILDSLRMAGLYREMSFFLSKLHEMEQGDYPVEFILNVRTQLYLYESSRLLHTGDFERAKRLMKEAEEGLFKKIPLMGLEDRLKLHLGSAILYLSTGEYVPARKSMKIIFSSGKLYHVLPPYKTARLVNLILQAELGNYDFFENEINSIKRNIRYEKQVYATEKLLFKFVQAYPLPSYEKSRKKLWEQFHREFAKIRQSKYERRLLQTFDFLSWIEYKLTRRPFAEILQEKTDACP
jgi:effector-binding domain-containing protein